MQDNPTPQIGGTTGPANPLETARSTLSQWAKENHLVFVNRSYGRVTTQPISESSLEELAQRAFKAGAAASNLQRWLDVAQRYAQMADAAIYQDASDQRNILEDIAEGLTSMLATSNAQAADKEQGKPSTGKDAATG
ncbi:hypothetical protein [Hydrogenophaga sp. NFH-34]|uniref:hypothetical protein n=1 Tax=Hydrogenophaga sp. NFH-34 TaxID=2744446 RepID=UPI001F218355|nr:hypothetical protein [Hydrogenophaga sp. NFH-34]